MEYTRDAGSFLPNSPEALASRGWDWYDFLFISGDAYVDHPSFGHAIISRLLESEGYRVAILAQPAWQSADAFARMPRPRLGVLIGGGVLDSMVNHYTAAKKIRSEDVYSPGGKAGLKPDRAVLVYANRAREVFGPGMPVIIGGVEASLRRFAHYDYHTNCVRRSALLDSRADILVYGMGERQIIAIAERLARAEKKDTSIPSEILRGFPGTCIIVKEKNLFHPDDRHLTADSIRLNSWDIIKNDTRAYAQSAAIIHGEQDPIRGKTLIEPYYNERLLIQYPPALPLDEVFMDKIYALPYTRRAHPCYEPQGGVPALEEVRFSITAHRGCFGGCSFCSLTHHQGRHIQKRSDNSILREAQILSALPDFKGYIHDVGGPTANFHEPACAHQKTRGACRDRQCLYPEPCPELKISHRSYLALLQKISQLPGIKKVFIRSGIRYDYVMYDNQGECLSRIAECHVSGQLKVAPEHADDLVLSAMGKPPAELYRRFAQKFKKINEKLGLRQFLIPYLISGHPGSTLKSSIALAEFCRNEKIRPEQVQQFYPTPGTLSACMYYTGLNPLTMEPVEVIRNHEEMAMHRALLQYWKPGHADLVRKALRMIGKNGLIGFGPKALVRPENRRRVKGKKKFKK